MFDRIEGFFNKTTHTKLIDTLRSVQLQFLRAYDGRTALSEIACSFRNFLSTIRHILCGIIHNRTLLQKVIFKYSDFNRTDDFLVSRFCFRVWPIQVRFY